MDSYMYSWMDCMDSECIYTCYQTDAYIGFPIGSEQTHTRIHNGFVHGVGVNSESTQNGLMHGFRMHSE